MRGAARTSAATDSTAWCGGAIPEVGGTGAIGSSAPGCDSARVATSSSTGPGSPETAMRWASMSAEGMSSACSAASTAFVTGAAIVA